MHVIKSCVRVSVVRTSVKAHNNHNNAATNGMGSNYQILVRCVIGTVHHSQQGQPPGTLQSHELALGYQGGPGSDTAKGKQQQFTQGRLAPE
jgi:hypothetical protein